MPFAGRAAGLSIGIESPRQADVARLIAALDAYLAALYPPESNHLVDAAALCAPQFRFFVARLGDAAVGCGALRVDPAGYGELKRMFVVPASRGCGVGRGLLHDLEERARREGLASIRLETGVRQPEALALYRAAGYRERGPFGEYVLDPLSVFLEKRLR